MFLESSQISQENTCARVSFLIKLQTEACNSLKKRFWRRCFPMNFAKFFRASFYKERLRWLLLHLAFNIIMLLDEIHEHSNKLAFWCNVRRKKLYSNLMQKHPQLKNKKTSKPTNKTKRCKSNFFVVWFVLNSSWRKKFFFETDFLSAIKTGFHIEDKKRL